MKYQATFRTKTCYLHTGKDHHYYRYIIKCAFHREALLIKVKWCGISLVLI